MPLCLLKPTGFVCFYYHLLSIPLYHLNHVTMGSKDGEFLRITRNGCSQEMGIELIQLVRLLKIR